MTIESQLFCTAEPLNTEPQNIEVKLPAARLRRDLSASSGRAAQSSRRVASGHPRKGE